MTCEARTSTGPRCLDELYAMAKEEGGNLVVWVGGDKPDQQDYIKGLFQKAFPDINIVVEVDLSKLHDARFDNALEGGSYVSDVLQLQTLHDFTTEKRRACWRHTNPGTGTRSFRLTVIQTGTGPAYTASPSATLSISDMIDEENAPRDALDYLDPALKGKVILTYPHDDDAMLYQFWQLKQKYSWDYLEKLIANDPVWVRGTAMPYVAINSGWYPASFTTFWGLVPFPDSPAKFLLPEEDFFLYWVQSGAIPKNAKNKAAAKLYMSWMLSKDFQGKWLQWPVRVDVKAPGGFKSVQHHNTDPVDFHKFMRNRAMVERFRAQMEQLIGPATGVSPLDADYSSKP